MIYNFDEVITRTNTNSIKWDAEKHDNLLPMWVADMDFKTAPEIIEALHHRLNHGIFGYSLTPPEFYSAIQYWWKKRHNLELEPTWIIPTTGIIQALLGIIKAYTTTNNQVLLLSPVYDHFFSSIENSDCKVITSELINTNGKFTINFYEVEELTAKPEVKLLIISNPHNPVGRVWTKEELIRLGEICNRNDVLVVSDEIHSDLVFPGFKHIPYASLGEAFSNKSITCCSPSKTFNLAGLQVGYVFSSNQAIKEHVEQSFLKQEMFLVSPFASTALIAAYEEGEAWVEALLTYLFNNYQYLESFIKNELPHVKVTPLEGTYLVWLDLNYYKINSTEFCDQLKENQSLWLNPGSNYGKAREGFVRMNIACPKSLLVNGLQRLKAALG